MIRILAPSLLIRASLMITLSWMFLPAMAQVKLAGVFGDHMVLQREMAIPVWGTATPLEQITVVLNKQKQKTKADPDGKWMVKLNPVNAGGPYVLEVTGKNKVQVTDVWVGEVWLCSGQSNMDMTVAREDRYWCGVYNEKEEVAAANYPMIRVYDVPFLPTDNIQDDVSGVWEVCSPQTVGHFSATAYFFARNLQQKIKVPIGLITTAYGASTVEAWTSTDALLKHPQSVALLEMYAKKSSAYDTALVAQQKYKVAYENWKVEAAKATAERKDKPREPKNPDPEKDQHSPAVLYNGMVAPLIPYAIRGALWYQGESNAPTASFYDQQMELMIADWRNRWHQGDFPFLYVQLANHQALITEPVKDDAMVLIREAQRMNLTVNNTGMVVAIDNANPDDPNDIHPKNKQAIGARLALLARAKVYGENIIASGPLYKRMVIEGNSIRIYFDHARQLKANGEILKGFAIAGKDKKFVSANAVIDGETVVVTSDEVVEPIAVRYGWAKNPLANLYNGVGLPASPFRTDVGEE